MPFKIWNFLNSGVLIGYESGKVDIMDGELNVILETDPVVEYIEILFMDCQHSKNDLKLVVVGVTKENLGLHLSLYSFEKRKESPSLVSNVSFGISGFENFKSLGFSFDGRHLSILGNLRLLMVDEMLNLTTFNIRSNSIDKVSHDLSLKLKDAKVLSFKLISNNHIAVLSVVKVGKKVMPQVTIWDNRYGTLQATIDIDMITLPDKFNRSQGSLNGFYDASGYFLTISLSSLSSSMVNTTHLLLPITLEPISLKSVIGKLANKSEVAYPLATLEYTEIPRFSKDCMDLNDLNKTMLSKLVIQNETEQFESAFGEWVNSNLEILSVQSKHSKNIHGKAWVDASAISVSQSQIKAIANACFDTESDLWPRNVIKYCLRNHIFYSQILEFSLIERIISKDDLELLWIAIHNLLDISEREWSIIIRYVLGLSSTLEFDKLFSKKAADKINNSLKEGSLSPGQDYICSLAFSSPKNNHLWSRALSSLEVNEMEKLLDWIGQIIIMKDERFMWWAWGEVGTDLPQKKLNSLFKRRNMAIEALSFLVDSNLVLVSTSPRLLEILTEIRLHINQECNFASYFQKRLFGMLKQFKKETPFPLEQNKSMGGRRWHRMVSDLYDNTGRYCVEVLKF
jgi:hypothetical protein